MKIMYQLKLFIIFNCLLFANITITMESQKRKNFYAIKELIDKKNELHIQQAHLLMNNQQVLENINKGEFHKTIFAGTTTYGYEPASNSFYNDIESMRLIDNFLQNKILSLLKSNREVNILLTGAGQMSINVAFILHTLKNFKMDNPNNNAKINIIYNDVDTQYFESFKQRMNSSKLNHQDINIIPAIGDIGKINELDSIKGKIFDLIWDENTMHLFNKRVYCYDQQAIYDQHLKNNPLWYIPEITKKLFNLLSKDGRLLIKHRTVISFPLRGEQSKPNELTLVKNQRLFYNALDKIFNDTSNENLNEPEKFQKIITLTQNLINSSGIYANLYQENLTPGDFFNANGGLIDFLCTQQIKPFIRLSYINAEIEQPSFTLDLDLLKKEIINKKEFLAQELTKNPLITIFERLKLGNDDFSNLKNMYESLRTHGISPDFQMTITIQK